MGSRTNDFVRANEKVIRFFFHQLYVIKKVIFFSLQSRDWSPSARASRSKHQQPQTQKRKNSFRHFFLNILKHTRAHTSKQSNKKKRNVYSHRIDYSFTFVTSLWQFVIPCPLCVIFCIPSVSITFVNTKTRKHVFRNFADYLSALQNTLYS